MASYEKYKTSDGIKWRIRYRAEYLGESKQYKKDGFDKKADAVFWYENSITKNINAPKYLTVSRLFNLYLNAKNGQIKNSTYANFEYAYRRHIATHFGNRKVSKITPADVRTWHRDLKAQGYAHAYILKLHSVLSAMINYGIKFHQLADNPLKQCGRPVSHEPRKEMDFWTEDEFKSFIRAVDELPWRAFFSFLYLTGARRGEALALQWRDINLDCGVVKIYKHINRMGVKGYEITDTKNVHSRREILMPAGLCTVMGEYKKYCEQLDGFCQSCFIFGHDKPLASNTIARRLVKYADIAGVKRIRVHDLRHSHASLLINKGQNILIVSQRLGHCDINRTLNTYSHLFPSTQKEILAAIDIKI